jgi:hypothetical protein
MKRSLVNLSLLLFILCFLFSCTSSKKMLEQRRYDDAVAKSVQELLKKPDNQKEIGVLSRAYALANEEDNERIKYCKQSNEPQVWEEIYDRYCRLKNRQDLLKPLDPSVKRSVNFTLIDYDQDIIDAKQKAADFLYKEGNVFLAKNNRYGSREAYARFTRVKEYLPAYQGIDDKINMAYSRSFTYIFFKIQNNSNRGFAPGFEDDLLKIGFKDQSYRWLLFDTRNDPKIKYDFTIILNIRKIDVTPELSTTTEAEETKEVENGSEYVRDADGKVQKDSSGNEIKRTKYKTLRCSVTRFSLGKNATVSGTLDFIDNSAGQIIKTDPVSAESKFEFVYALVRGDREAMSPETRKLTTLKIAPFPSNDEMIMQTADDLKKYAKEVVHRNRQLLK